MELIEAARNNNIENVRLLLDNDADPNELDDDGNTALIWASQGAYTDIVRLLLEKGADPSIRDDDGWTALTVASHVMDWGHTDIIRLIRSHMAATQFQRRIRGRRERERIRTQKSKQRLALAKTQDHIAEMSGRDLEPTLFSNISRYLHNMPYHPEVTRRMEEEERMRPYIDWLQEFPISQSGSGKRSSKNNSKRSSKNNSKRSSRGKRRKSKKKRSSKTKKKKLNKC